MTKFKLIAIGFCSFLLYSCGCELTYLSKDEKKWCSAYKEGQQVIFKGNRNNTDTITVSSILEGYTECSRLYSDRQEHFISIQLKLNQCKEGDFKCEGLIGVQKISQDKVAFPFFRIFGLEYVAPLENYNLQKVNVKLANGKSYNSAYCFTDKVNASNYGIKEIISFVWDKKAGLIKYETVNGEVFELQ